MKASPSASTRFIAFYGLVVLTGFGGLVVSLQFINMSLWGVMVLWLGLMLTRTRRQSLIVVAGLIGVDAYVMLHSLDYCC